MKIIYYRNFKKQIDKKGITSYRVAKDTGISQVTLCDWKQGASTPKTDKLIKISNYLGISLEELTKEESEGVLNE